MKLEHPHLSINGNKISAVFAIPDHYKNLPNDKKKLVILVHGGPGGTKSGPGNLFLKLSPALIDVGIATLRFDFLGEGESEGDYIDMTISNQVKEYYQILDFARNQNFGSIGLLGESYGATIALAGITPDIQVLVLLWPAIYLLDTTFNLYLESEALQELEEKGFILEGSNKIGEGFINELQSVKDVEEYLQKVSVPTLFIHGDSDSEVPHWQSEKAFKLLRDPKELIIVPEGDHMLDKPNEQQLVVENTVEWFKKHL